MIDSLNIEAFELVSLVSKKPKEPLKERVELTGSTKERGFNDWSDKIVGNSVGRTTNHIDKTIEIFLSDENGSLGFEGTKYSKFESLIRKFLSLDYLNEIVTFNFIETEAFNWVIDVYKNQKAESNLYDYLIASIDKKVKSKTFYFPVLNLEIEKAFKIGNVEFTYFTKEYFDKLYETSKKKDKTITKENFKQIFRKDFQGQVLAKITIKAESDKAEEIAKTYAEISVDVLKLYSDSAIVPEKKTMFDLNFRLGYQVKTNFLTEEPNNLENGLAISMQFNNRPFNFSQRHYLSANQNGLKIFSDYISKNKSDELHEIIIQSIHLFGSAISNWDLHLRCVNLITILESTLLKDNEDWKMESKVKRRLSNLLSNDNKEKEKLQLIIKSVYQVRHKMIHKAKRINIDFKELSNIQMIMINLFLRLIQFNTEFQFKDKETLIDKLEEENANA
jgi:hypothetical protein